MTLLRGRKIGLEIALGGRQLDEALDELDARLAERPGFYRSTAAVANFGETEPSFEQVARLTALCAEAGLDLRAFAGNAAIEVLADRAGVAFEPAAQPEHELDRRRAMRPQRDVELSDAARNLVADFAGARADIAERRRRGDTSVPRLEPSPAVRAAVEEPAPAVLHVVEAPPETLYHAGTLRGGQAVHHLGNVVVVGDVNPGAELIASGDIVIFGRLAGVAHAGAQGDEAARVYALDLCATQLRIATFIASDDGSMPHVARPEAAMVRDGRIVVVPFEHLADAGASRA